MAYLLWDVTLAAVPLASALALEALDRRGASRAARAAVGACWLAFFPNAPYLVTEFVHFRFAHARYDVALFATLAVTGLLLGSASLLLVHRLVLRRFGRIAAAVFAPAALAAVTAGIWLGRVRRLNSWDFVERPHRVWAIFRIRLADPFGNPAVNHVGVVLFTLLAVSYLLVVAAAGFTRPRFSARPSGPRAGRAA
jgi:uncharacterized membrane protein